MWQLMDAVERNRKYPLTFLIPSDDDVRKLAVGDFAKVSLRAVVRPICGPDGERFWVRVTRAEYPHFAGTIANELIFSRLHNRKARDEITFEARHVLSVKPPGHRAPRRNA